MLLLPLRSPQHLRVRQEHNNDDNAAAAIYPALHKGIQFSENRHGPDSQDHPADSMMSTLPSARIPVTKRPKLSLQTSSASTLPAGHKSKTALNLTAVSQSPTYGNTYANALNCTFQKTDDWSSTPRDEKISPQSSPEDRVSSSSSSTSATTSSSCHTSPFPMTAPYCLPLGPRSILRNSPLPRRLVSASATRTPKLLFPRSKQVCFRERLEELIPTSPEKEAPNISEGSDSDSSDQRLEDDIAERKALDNLLEEETATTWAHGRRKRRREWIWRPLKDDVLSPQHRDSFTACAAEAPPSSERPMPEPKWEDAISLSPQNPRHSDVKPDVSEGILQDPIITFSEDPPPFESSVAT